MRASNRRNTPHRAPGDLRIVQAFLATDDRSAGVDTLSHPRALSDWMCRHGLLDAGVELDRADLDRALDVRAGVYALVAVHDAAALDTGAVQRLDRVARQARPRLRFHGDGTSHYDSASFETALGHLVDLIARARRNEHWNRLKICADSGCQAVFYDLSSHRRRKWCTQRCGARIRNRNYRRGETYRRTSHRGAPRLPRLFRPPEDFDL